MCFELCTATFFVLWVWEPDYFERGLQVLVSSGVSSSDFLEKESYEKGFLHKVFIFNDRQCQTAGAIHARDGSGLQKWTERELFYVPSGIYGFPVCNHVLHISGN
jgi:hypothetical protein